jgi:HEAT repeat protein
MKFSLVIPVALLALGSAATLAQAPAKPAKPATPATRPIAPVPPTPSMSKPETKGAASPDEELALAALEGLMMQPPERALPIIKKVLAGTHTTTVKQRALFVLSQIDSPEARQILVQASRSPDLALRREAIRDIGIGGDPTALDALQDLYKTGDAEAKSDVLQAWLIAGRKEAVFQAALNAKTEEEASAAIHILGAMGATDELRKLGDRPNTPRGLPEAFAISGDLQSLRKLAENSSDRAVRLEAVQKMGIVGDDAARGALRDIYTRSDDKEIKDAALQGLMIAGDDKGVLALYKAAKTGDEKRALLRTLSMMDSDVAIQAIDAALEEKK